MAMAEGRIPPADPDPPEMHRTTEQTRAGSTEHIVRYVLAISLALAVIVMLVILYFWSGTGS